MPSLVSVSGSSDTSAENQLSVGFGSSTLATTHSTKTGTGVTALAAHLGMQCDLPHSSDTLMIAKLEFDEEVIDALVDDRFNSARPVVHAQLCQAIGHLRTHLPIPTFLDAMLRCICMVKQRCT